MTSEEQPASEPEPAGSASAAADGSPGAATARPPPPAPRFPLQPDRLSAVAASLYEWLSRPRVRLTVTGVILLLVGGLLVTHSVWTLPLVIVGALMVVIAWIGRRLDGRFAVEWGETGTQLEFRARVKTAESARPAVLESTARAHYLARAADPEPEDAEVVEGEAHTVEVDVADLKALIAAAEIEEAEIGQPEPSAQAKRNLRVAHGGVSSESPG